VIIYAGIELWAGVTGTASGIAHFAHLGGMLFGLVLLMIWKRKR
jgi:membrane associated rhomboid family serine protease